MIYCVVPYDLAAELHEPLREHYRNDPEVAIVVELRQGERRGHGDRRAEWLPDRRLADRRAFTLAATPPTLPSFAEAHAGRLSFLERFEPRGVEAEDIETNRALMRIREGDHASFTEIYLRYFDRVFGYARVAVRDLHEAEDLTQQVFLQALTHLDRYEPRDDKPFRAWLFTVARHQVIDHLRRHNRLEVREPETIRDRLADRSPADFAPLDLQLSWLSDREIVLFIERLPLAQRQVLVLRHLADLSTNQIASVLERSPEAVRQLEYRALVYLRRRLGAVGHRRTNIERQPIRQVLRQAPVVRSRRFSLR